MTRQHVKDAALAAAAALVFGVLVPVAPGLWPRGARVSADLRSATAGAPFVKGDFIAEVHDLRKVTVEIAVPELNIGDVRAGQPVRLKARASTVAHGCRVKPGMTASLPRRLLLPDC